MKKLSKNELGFGALEVILILIIVAIIGGVGWYVIHNRAKTTTSSSTTPATSQARNLTKPKTTETVDPTTSWITYSSKAGQYSLKYPKTWATASSPELCTEGLLLLGGNDKSVGKCASEAFGQMGVYSVKGNQVADLEIKSSESSDLKTETVTINGVKGKKQTGSYNTSFEGGPEVTEKKTIYIFYDGQRTYTATYYINPAYPDVLSDFNLMVTKTLKFQP